MDLTEQELSFMRDALQFAVDADFIEAKEEEALYESVMNKINIELKK